VQHGEQLQARAVDGQARVLQDALVDSGAPHCDRQLPDGVGDPAHFVVHGGVPSPWIDWLPSLGNYR
jgi:hypothetical protein